MKDSKKKLNLIDFFIIFSIFIIICSAILQGIAVSKFEESNYFEDTIITLRMIDVDETIIDEIEKGDYIFSNVNFGEDAIGIVEQKLKHSLGDTNVNGEQTVEIVEYEIQIASRCLKNSNGFYHIGKTMIAPGMIFYADNGFVGFNCEVVSIKSLG